MKLFSASEHISACVYVNSEATMSQGTQLKRSQKTDFSPATVVTRERSFIRPNKDPQKRRSQTMATIKGKPTMEIYRPPNVRTDILPNSGKLNVHAKEFTMTHELQPSKSSGNLSGSFDGMPLQHSKSSGNILRHMNPTLIPIISTPLPLPLLHSTSTSHILNHVPRVSYQFGNEILAHHIFSGHNQSVHPNNWNNYQQTNNNSNLKRSKSLGASDSQNLAAKLKNMAKEEIDLGLFSAESQANIKLAMEDPNQLSSRAVMDLVKIIMERVVEGIRYCETGAKLCISIIEKEKNQTFLESLLNMCQQWYQERDKILRGIKAGDAEASQVRWNKISSNLLATAHDGDIKIWDQRKGTAPVQYVAAHLSKIHGLDWNPNTETQLATSSQDNTVKFFDMTNPRRAEYVLTTNAPVWRARFTPFGNGLVTVVVPQLRRGENSLLLWNTANRSTPMHTFIGHRDVVLEFEWRKQMPGSSDFQLITWSKDQTLLVWKIEPFLQKLCGHEPDEPREEVAVNTESSEIVKIRKKTLPKIQPLQQEFSLLNVHIPNLEVTAMDSATRTCTVFANVNSFMVNLQVSFPNAYPHGVPPVFQIMPESTVNDTIGTQLLQTLNHLAQQRVSKNRTCLESCLRQMVTTLEQLSTDSENDRIFDSSYAEPNNVFGGYNDAYIPFPRTSGAKFCSVGILVCFGRAPHARRFSGKLEATTPRALSALETIFSKRSSDHVTVSNYYYHKQRFRVKHSKSKPSKAVVHVYDVSGLLLANKQLAEEYILDGDVATICKHNAATAAVVGRWDLVQAWTLAELIACTQSKNEEWYNHPFGNQLSEAL
ncbi:hypothetical protein GEV33_012941 [Tenebrio molitor]|uniref:RWD domain-containing protein n=1 Tax=Tenebrio molitor TaxID=7067 RepID=A0A8J6H8V8_TENMO|nr:hypothetical protein GEV33_012941 [Tenebrio molitor]